MDFGGKSLCSYPAAVGVDDVVLLMSATANGWSDVHSELATRDVILSSPLQTRSHASMMRLGLDFDFSSYRPFFNDSAAMFTVDLRLSPSR
jgi:hypothetical protein